MAARTDHGSPASRNGHGLTGRGARGESRGMTGAPANLWRNREFNLLWISQSLSDLGNAIATLAVPLLILHLTHSPVRAGLVATIGLVTMVLCRLPAGVLVDRVDRRRLMLAC